MTIFPKVLEICAGAGGQALGLEQAGFDHVAAVEIEPVACETLHLNRPHWNVINGDVRSFSAREYAGVDLVAGGVPCPPYSVAGNQLGAADDRDLFPEAMRIVREAAPRAVLFENVPGFMHDKFSSHRMAIFRELEELGYDLSWDVLNACDFGVPQSRPRLVIVGLRKNVCDTFRWPERLHVRVSVGEKLVNLMGARGWPGAALWAARATGVGPTLVGGSKKHGGADLGPTRARQKWLTLGVDGRGLADEAPGPEHPVDFVPRLTAQMAAIVQGFDPSWRFAGRKTAAYRQIGNAFPSPVASAVGRSLLRALSRKD